MAVETKDANGTKEQGSRYKRVKTLPDNQYLQFVQDQDIAIVPTFELETGFVLNNVPVAYKTYGELSQTGDNAMVICHALTGSADAGDWWGPLLGGEEKAFDKTRFFIICFNSLGSPYGSASPVTHKDGDTSLGQQGLYGPEFPLTTVRDDVNIFKLILDDLGVKQVAAVIGGSMGGMLVLEFAYFGKAYVRNIIAIATAARYSAWGISWGEAQRQSIYSDPLYQDGYYPPENPPMSGLGAARMSALLTYRSRDSFESRFGRTVPDMSRNQKLSSPQKKQDGSGTSNEHFDIHNHGHRNVGAPRATPRGSSSDLRALNGHTSRPNLTSADSVSSLASNSISKTRTPTYFSTQSYLRYQSDKFTKRFDANCYIAITRKLDTHDVSRNRVPDDPDLSPEEALKLALGQIEQPTLVLGIQSDGLFAFSEQQELAEHIPNARLERIISSDGHDAFLLEFKQVNEHLLKFLREQLRDMYERAPAPHAARTGEDAGFDMANGSLTGEAEVEDITAW